MNVPVPPALRWSSVRLVLGVLVVLVASAMWLCGALLVPALEARMQERWQVYQSREADLWARMLAARLETPQRLLATLAEGWQVSPAHALAVPQQRQVARLRGLESLHWALPTGEVRHYPVQAEADDLDSQGVDALRRTMAEGKPFVTHMVQAEDSQHLRVLFTVPVRDKEGRMTAAWAATVKLPASALMPDMDAADNHLQYLLLDAQGQVLLHTDSARREPAAQQAVPAALSTWLMAAGAVPTTADTRLWGHLLVSRVGLTWPQWQLVVVRDVSSSTWREHGVPISVWAALLGGGVLLALLAAGLLWGWLAPWPVRGTQVPDAVPLPPEAMRPEVTLPASEQEGMAAMLEAVPAALLLEHQGRVTLATAQARVMLGYLDAEAAVPAMAALFDDEVGLAAVYRRLVDFGSLDARLRLRKKDGDWLWVDVQAWTPAQQPDTIVWQLQLPWRPQLGRAGQAEQVSDALTGLPQREAFIAAMAAWVSDSTQAEPDGRQPEPPMPAQGCLLFADLDHLGMMNAATSRDMGDRVLRHVAHLVAVCTQPVGYVARLGGDKFAVLLPGMGQAHAQRVGQLLCDAVWRWQPSWGGERHWVSISIGIVAVDARQHTAQQAIHAADMACYEAKRRGRCQVAVGQMAALQTPPPQLPPQS